MSRRIPSRPVGTDWHTGRPEVGMVVAFDFAIWRVVAVYDRARIDWDPEDEEYISALSAGSGGRDPDWVRRKYPYSAELQPIAGGSKRLHLAAGGRRSEYWWDVYTEPEHYPVCSCCGGPTPCRWLVARDTGEKAIEKMGRYENAGVCPACQEPVSARQKSLTWLDNIELPGGPPVTFHMRGGCRGWAIEYEKRWVAEAPEQRRARLSCVGRVVTHGDGTYECSEITDCPGPVAAHRSFTSCRRYGLKGAGCTDPACTANPSFGCDLRPTFGQRLPDGTVRGPDRSIPPSRDQAGGDTGGTISLW